MKRSEAIKELKDDAITSNPYDLLKAVDADDNPDKIKIVYSMEEEIYQDRIDLYEEPINNIPPWLTKYKK